MNPNKFSSDILLIKSFVKTWTDVPDDQIKFDRLAGLSNVIWKVSVPDNIVPSAIVYRQFGDNEEIIDRQRENYIFTQLSSLGLGPSYIGGDHKARLEEYYDSSSLNPAEVLDRKVRCGVAKNLAGLHKVELEGLETTPIFLKHIEEGSLAKSVEVKARREGIYTEQEQIWLDEMLSLIKEEEINFLKQIAPKGKESVVFSHNDLHSQNILKLRDESQKLVLIDYEYSGYNYRGYDLANYCNEAIMDYSNPEYPYYHIDEKKYPTELELKDFIKSYVFFSKFEAATMEPTVSEETITTTVKEEGDLDQFEAEVDEILKEVRACAMFSHYYWILWSILMSKHPDIQFDYLHYAYSRFKVYQSLKEECLLKEYPNIEEVSIGN